MGSVRLALCRTPVRTATYLCLPPLTTSTLQVGETQERSTYASHREGLGLEDENTRKQEAWAGLGWAGLS